MRRLTWVIAILLAAAAQSAGAQDIDYRKSEITFAAKQMNVPAEGRFRKFTTQIAFDPRQPDATRAESRSISAASTPVAPNPTAR
jgi:polyisoprenoid-binding protein YceI